MMPPITFSTMPTIPPTIFRLRTIAWIARIRPMIGRKKKTRLKMNGTAMVITPTRHAQPAEPVNCERRPAVPPAPMAVGRTGGGGPGDGAGGADLTGGGIVEH